MERKASRLAGYLAASGLGAALFGGCGGTDHDGPAGAAPVAATTPATPTPPATFPSLPGGNMMDAPSRSEPFPSRSYADIVTETSETPSGVLESGLTRSRYRAGGAVDQAADRADVAVQRAGHTVDSAVGRVDSSVDHALDRANSAVDGALHRTEKALDRADGTVRKVGGVIKAIGEGLEGDYPPPPPARRR